MGLVLIGPRGAHAIRKAVRLTEVSTVTTGWRQQLISASRQALPVFCHRQQGS